MINDGLWWLILVNITVVNIYVEQLRSDPSQGEPGPGPPGSRKAGFLNSRIFFATNRQWVVKHNPQD